MIELTRFLASCGIAIFHFEWIYLGHPVYFRHFYLWVEFFFVLSGFFLARNVLENKEEDTFSAIRWMKKEAIKLWIPFFFAFIFSFVVYCLVKELRNFYDIATMLFASKWEIFFMHLSGFDMSAPMINGVTAYIPALLISGLAVHYLIRKHYALLANIIIPITPIFIYSHIINTYGNLSQWLAYEGWYTIGILRGFAGILIGTGVYLYGQKSNDLFRGGRRRLLYCFLVSIVVLAIAALVFCRDLISYSDELIYPYIFGIMLFLLFFREHKTVNKVIEWCCLKLGGISYNIYLMHYGICYLFLYYFGGKSYGFIAPVYIFIVLVMSIIMNVILMLFYQKILRKRT